MDTVMNYGFGPSRTRKVGQGGVADVVVLIAILAVGLVIKGRNATTEGEESFLCIGLCTGVSTDKRSHTSGEDMQKDRLDVQVQSPEGHTVRIKRGKEAAGDLKGGENVND